MDKKSESAFDQDLSLTGQWEMVLPSLLLFDSIVAVYVR